MGTAVTPIRIGEHEIGAGRRPLIVAEIGFNHNGSLLLAKQMVSAAAACGCDAVKFQAFHGPELFSPNYRATRDDGSRWTPAQFYGQYELGEPAFEQIAAHCRETGVLFLCTPFDLQAVDMLRRLDAAAYKIASGDLTHEVLIRACAAAGRPLIISTGMSGLTDVEAAIRFCEGQGNRQIILLHCTSSYPCNPQDVHLRAMQVLYERFGYPVGFSDHTLDAAAAVGATALGAVLVEKHFTTDRSLPGFDQAMSADPPLMQSLVEQCRTVHASLGEARKEQRPSEAVMSFFGARSLVYARDLPAGTALVPEHLGAKRPGMGIPARERSLVLGRRLRCPVPAEGFVRWEDLDGGEG